MLSHAMEALLPKSFFKSYSSVVKPLWMFLFLFGLTGCARRQDLLDASLFSNVLHNLKDNVLGVKEMQEYFDRLDFVHEQIDGKRLIQNLARQLRQKFQEKVEVADKIRESIETAYSDGSITTGANFPLCCKINPENEDYRFRTKIITNQMCEQRASSLQPNAKHLPKSVLDTLIKNSKDKPNTRWQYFGSQEGIYYNFPAVKFQDCSSYDHRVRPWYVQGISPEAKDIVIVIDKSGSMTKRHGGKTLMEIAIDAAVTVLDSLNPKDRVGIVDFSSVANTPPGDPKTSSCYQTQLATAVPVNIKYLKKYLKNIRATGNTYYGVALRKAFELLKVPNGSNETFKRKKVVLFLTDGEPTDDEFSITQTVNSEKRSLLKQTKTSAVIFAYGIGGNKNFQLLEKLADDTEAEGTKGRFIAIGEKDIGQLRSVFSSFYDLFARTTIRRTFSLSVPYYDALGLGTLVSIVVPCWHKQKVIGVAGTDVIFSELISDVFYFSKGQYSYAFLIDRGTGDTIIHPFMPTLQNARDDPVILHISALEQEKEFSNSVLPSMIRGEEGQLSFVSARYLPLGSGENSGVRKLLVKSTYFWKAVDGTNLSVCVVQAENGTVSRLTSSFDERSADSVIYHREIDLKEKKVGFEECSHYGRRATKGRAVVKFSAQSFEKPYDYISLIETQQSVDVFKEYLRSGQRNPEPKFKPGIRELTLAGIEAEKIWNAGSSRAKDYTTYLTYATTTGIIVLKPGLVIDKVYDPSQRLWFQSAINNKGQLTLSTPYLDGFGSGFLVDVLHTLYEGKRDGKHSPSDDAVAVLDASFGMFQFYRLVTEQYPKCHNSRTRCFIMDRSGFLVIHKYFVDFKALSDLNDFSQKIGSIHVTQQEKSVSEDLIENGILRRNQCKQYKEIRTENFYEVHLRGTWKSNGCPQYQLTQLNGTNAYLGIVRDNSGCSRTSGACPCPTFDNNVGAKDCVCPFQSTLEYNFCRNEFPPDSVPLCAVAPPILNSFDAPEEAREDLKSCFDEDCNSTQDEEECYRHTSCSWCEYSKRTSTFLKIPFCKSNEKCYGGVEGNKLSSLYPKGKKNEEKEEEEEEEKKKKKKKEEEEKEEKDKTDDGSSSNLGVIVGCAVAAVFLLILIIISVKIYHQKSRSRSSRDHSKEERPASVIPPRDPNPSSSNQQQAVRHEHSPPYTVPNPGPPASYNSSAPPPVNPQLYSLESHGYLPYAGAQATAPPAYYP